MSYSILHYTPFKETQRKRALDLPVYTKYLLIAAFLASYNAAKFDQRFFARFISDQGKRKKRGGARKAVADAARAASVGT